MVMWACDFFSVVVCGCVGVLTLGRLFLGDCFSDERSRCGVDLRCGVGCGVDE